MEKRNEKLYQESFDFISQNLNVTTDQIPDHLLQYWISSDIEKQPFGNNKDYAQLGVFMIGFSANEVRKGNITYQVDEDTVHSIFMRYQYILNMEDLRRKIEISFEPIRIFDFDSYGEELTISANPHDLNYYKSIVNKHLRK